MENIFENNIIPRYYFSNLEKYLKLDLFDYLYDNLYIEDTLTWDLRHALTTNANE
jgi:hypothetical protein